MIQKRINQSEETRLITELGNQLWDAGFNAGNSCIIIVSPERSSIVGQCLRHRLSVNGKVCDGFGIDVPELVWDAGYQYGIQQAFTTNMSILRTRTPIFVKSRVTTGEHYRWITEWMRKYLAFDKKIITLALYENLHSGFKSDFVGEYWDNETEDLTFWWE